MYLLHHFVEVKFIRPFVLSAFFLLVFTHSSQSQITRLGTETQVNSSSLNTQTHPVAAMAPNQNFVAVWQSFAQDGSDFGIYFQRYDNAGIANGVQILANSTTNGGQQNPDIAMAIDGRYAICWMSHLQDGDGFGIYFKRFSALGSAIGGEIRANTTTANNQKFPRIGSDANLNTVLVWEDEVADGDSWGIHFQRYNSSGIKLGSETQANSTTANAQHAPDVAVNPNGDFIIVWQGINASGNYDIYAQRYNSSGVAQGTELIINTTTTGHQIAPRAAIDSLGNFVVVWTSEGQDGSGAGIYATMLDNSGNVSIAEFQVNNTTTSAQDFGEVQMLKEGGFVICWNSFLQDGDAYGNYLRVYNRIGQHVLTNDVLINTHTTDYQQFPVIAGNQHTDSIVAVWQSGDNSSSVTQDNSDYGIYMQRAELDIPAVVVANCSNAILYLDQTASGSLAASEIDNGSYADEMPISFSLSPSIFSCGNEGINPVVLTVSDASLNTASCSATVNVKIDSVAYTGTSGNLTIAANATEVDLFDFLSNAPDTGGVWSGNQLPYNGYQGTFNPNFMPSGIYTYTIENIPSCPAASDFSTVTVMVTPVVAARLQAKVFLEGTLDTLSLLMMDSLRSNAWLPLMEPFTDLGYVHINGGGNENFDTSLLNNTGLNALVDWVVIEARDPNDSSLILASRSALLQRDGDIVDLDGSSSVAFNRLVAGSYYVVIGHRNHLFIMTNVAVPMNNLAFPSIDFTNVATAPTTNLSQKHVITSLVPTGFWVMIGGDANMNGQVQNTDDVIFWIPQSGGSGYLEGDYNCDGQVQNSDKVEIWNINVGNGTEVPPRSN